jgi:phage regulator Rha-like protein
MEPANGQLQLKSMENQNGIVVQPEIENRIYTIRNVQVMLDSHLAELYNVEAKQLNRAVKRNLERFPVTYHFQLTAQEFENLRCQIGTSSFEHGGRRYLPYVFTEQGVAMLSAVLRSEIAVKVSIQIINAFIEMRKFLLHNAGLLQRMDKVESKILEYDARFERIFTAIESQDITPKQNIFYDGQIYDAYSFAIQLIEKANSELILIDNYLDNSVLDMLTKKKKNVKVKLLTQPGTSILTTDMQKFNRQFPTLRVELTNVMHDRFLLIDQSELYHIGASFKDLGKKCFAFSLIEDKSIMAGLMDKI